MVKKIQRLIILLGLCAASTAWGADRNGPAWNALKQDHQAVLSPLESEWGNFDAPRKAKWLSIANQYPKMGKQEQQRIQNRMRTWANLTPEQRQVARESYRDFSRLPEAHRQEVRQKWEEYRKLPDDERRRFIQDSSRQKN